MTATMIKFLHLFSLLLPLLPSACWPDDNRLIPLIASGELFLLLSRFFYLKMEEIRKHSVTVGLKDFYTPALIMQMIASLLILFFWYYDLHRITDSEIHQIIWILSYVVLLIVLESRKKLFLVNRKYLFHRVGFHITMWQLTDIRKINMMADRIEFVRGDTKLKAILGHKSVSSVRLHEFLQRYAGTKLRIATGK